MSETKKRFITKDILSTSLRLSLYTSLLFAFFGFATDQPVWGVQAAFYTLWATVNLKVLARLIISMIHKEPLLTKAMLTAAKFLMLSVLIAVTFIFYLYQFKPIAFLIGFHVPFISLIIYGIAEAMKNPEIPSLNIQNPEVVTGENQING